MKNIVTEVVPVERDSEAFLGHSHTANGTNRGYIMGLPLQLSKNTVNQEKTPLIAKQAQKLFIDTYNPKFIQRQANMFNKKQDFAGTKEFFDENLSGKTTLNSEKLDILNKKLASELQAERLEHAQSLGKK